MSSQTFPTKAKGVLLLPASVCPSIRMTKACPCDNMKNIFLIFFQNLPGIFIWWISQTSSVMTIAAHVKCVRNWPKFTLTYLEFLKSVFYTPVWKTGRIMPWQCPSVRLSVRLSVRPSVRPRFPDFSSTCFEISIWNLVYAFSRWHDMSSLSCITIGSIWPSLQPKVGQTYFLQSWPHKSR